jgi:hypothetical protein
MRMLRMSALAASILLLCAGLAACGSGSSRSSVSHGSVPAGTSSRFTAEPSLAHCPKEMPEFSGGPPGGEGKVVGQAPLSAVVCRWRVEANGRFVAAESVVLGRKLTGLVDALNSLPPGLTGDIECESGINLWYLIGFRFGAGSGTEVEADYTACGAVRTKQRYWGIDGEVRERLDALLPG